MIDKEWTSVAEAMVIPYAPFMTEAIACGRENPFGIYQKEWSFLHLLLLPFIGELKIFKKLIFQPLVFLHRRGA